MDAIDILAGLFPRCAELGIEVPEDMPLGTDMERKAAVVHLAREVFRAERGVMERSRELWERMLGNKRDDPE